MAITRNHQAEYKHYTPSEVKIIDGVPVKYSDVLVHEFVMGDVEDPDLYIAEPLWNWQTTDTGAWVMEHAIEKPYWIKQLDRNTYGYQCKIFARLSEADELFFRLKYVGTKN